MATSGRIYRWLAEATKKGGSQRALYTSETTLSRRGLLTRADRRARELQSAGVAAGDLVAIALGNVADYFVALMAVSKLGAVAMPVDPANGDGRLLAAMRRLPVRLVIRRHRGLDGAPLEFPRGYTLRSRRQLPSTMVALDLLDPPANLPRPPAGTELAIEAIGGDGVERDVLRDAGQLEAIGDAARELLALEAGTRLVCVQPLTAPSFFDPVILGWLASSAQLVITGGPTLDGALPLAQGAERLVVVDATGNFLTLARALKVSNQTIDLVPVLPGPSASPLPERSFEQRFGHKPRELLQIEELGIVAAREGAKAKTFTLAPNVRLEAGSTFDDGTGLVVHTPQAGTVVPTPPPGAPGARTDDGGMWSGWVASLDKNDDLRQVVRRSDALVRIEGRRAPLDRIEAAMLAHSRITWAQPYIDVDPDGEPVLKLRYVATGETELEDIEEHAVGELDPYMVPRAFERLSEVPA